MQSNVIFSPDAIFHTSDSVRQTGKNSFSLTGEEDALQTDELSSLKPKSASDGAWLNDNGVELDHLRNWVNLNHPNALEQLRKLPGDSIINVLGEVDHEELALRSLGINFKSVNGAEFNRLDLSKTKVIIVNCPGILPDPAPDRIVEFLQNGGYLVTTDLAAGYLLGNCFKGNFRNSQNRIRSANTIVKMLPGETDLALGISPQGKWTEESPGSFWTLSGKGFEFTIAPGPPRNGARFIYHIDPGLKPIPVAGIEDYKIDTSPPPRKSFFKHKSASTAYEPRYLPLPFAITFHYQKGRVLHLAWHFDDTFSDVVPEMGTSIRQAILLNFLIAGLSSQFSKT
jgi:hypothetical protein